MTIPAIERATGISKSTLYRWRGGQWTRDPSATEVRAFCDGLGIPHGAAYQVLGWSGEERQATEPLLLEPEIEAIARKLRDPNVADAEKAFIRETLRRLAAPATQRAIDSRRTG